MKYQISIVGMHCNGCSQLIKMSLEEQGLENVSVNIEENNSVFESSKELAEVNNILSEVFKDLPDYKFTNLNLIN